MRNLLGTLSLLFLGVWLGALFFFGVVAYVAFSVLPPLFPDHAAATHAAGLVVGGSLNWLHSLGFICGVLFLLLTLILSRLIHWHSYMPQAVLVVAMLVLTAFSQLYIIPQMNTARDSVGGEIDAVSATNPGRQIFDRLHVLSTRVEGTVLVCGVFAFLLGGRPQKMRQLP